MKKNLSRIILVVVVIILLISGSSLIVNFNKGRRDVFDVEISENEIVKTKYYDFDDGTFSIKLPVDFKLMNTERVMLKYPNEKKPNIVYTNEDASINVAINLTDLDVSSVKEYTNLVRSTFDPIYKDVVINIFDYEGHQIGEVKLISPAEGEYIYNHMIFFTMDGKLRIINFNCTSELQNNWVKVGDFIMDSLVFND